MRRALLAPNFTAARLELIPASTSSINSLLVSTPPTTRAQTHKRRARWSSQRQYTPEPGGIRPQKCRLDIQPRQGAYCGCGPDYFIHGCAILQEGGANDKEELHRTSPSDGRLPASSSDPLRIVTRWIPTVGNWRRGH